ncbi:FkbM family methyltransferase [Pedobacter sp. ISL-68]|uniref:FkbM family methyltransferase n=1 Tax=unclassified Pedobacter TaxID=2628915 RepID=UPI001BEA9FAF|nr:MULTISPECIES: FkbM family methyltransferase [unclassified Pedobacter]MBT2562809.1 FkbM family methyltransferase [Pedobacter sp. ISL-64]MBT2593322.1 FkbM family methyltransferase [Pedobacter sp. ISL-68]
MKAFGIEGLSILRQVELEDNDELIVLQLPRLKEKIYLRKNTSDIGVFQEIFIDQNYQALLALKDHNIVVDAGANIGLFALYILKEHPNAQLFCIEPEDSNYEMLKKNTAGYPHITILKRGLWNCETYLKFIDLKASKWAFQLTESTNNNYDIHGISIADIYRDFNLGHIDILKIDIEGSEKELFEKSTSWLSKVKNLIIETHEDMRPGSTSSVMDALSPYHFAYVKLNNNHFFTTVLNQSCI